MLRITAVHSTYTGLPGASLDFLLRSPVHATLLVQSNGTVEAASPATVADLGTAPDQIIGRTIELVTGVRVDQLAAAADNAGALHRGPAVRFRVHRLDGDHGMVAYFVELAVAPVDHDDFTDLVASRAERLDEIANELADRYDELNRFVGVVSHDVQAPLRRLLSFAELLRADLDDPSQEVTSSLDHIEAGATHLLRLTQELLAYARLGTGPLPLHPVDGDETLRFVLDQLDDDLEHAGATVAVHGEIGTVAATDRFLALVFQNLVENAVKYRRPDVDPVVTITAEASDDGVAVHVADNGIGIATTDRAQVFEPMRRTRRDRGDLSASFGLAAVARLMDRFGGDVAVTASAPDAGSTFTVRFRRPDPDA